MKPMQFLALILSMIALMLTGILVFFIIVNFDRFKPDNRPLTTAATLESYSSTKPVVKPSPTKPASSATAAPSTTIAPSPSQSNPVKPAAVQSAMPSSVPTEAPAAPAARSTQAPSELIVGRWRANDNPVYYFEFFEDGSFTRGRYEAKNDYNEFSGTYSFSGKSRLKLQNEKWTIEMDSPVYKNTRVDNASHVYEITVTDSSLVIPEAKESMGVAEWTRVD
jgi:hypothetical protein